MRTSDFHSQPSWNVTFHESKSPRMMESRIGKSLKGLLLWLSVCWLNIFHFRDTLFQSCYKCNLTLQALPRGPLGLWIGLLLSIGNCAHQYPIWKEIDVIQLWKLRIRFWLSDHCVFLEPEENKINTILVLIKIINIMLRRKMPSWWLVRILLLNINFPDNVNFLQDNTIHHFYSWHLPLLKNIFFSH